VIEANEDLTAPLMGTVLASKLFGVALLCSGQSSTLTGTMAGQIIMEGFLNIRVRPWLRRLVTRLLAVAPAVGVIWFAGPRATFGLLLLSQVVLNLQLPFAIIPLLQFTNDRTRMGDFASKWPLRLAGWAIAVLGAMAARGAAAGAVTAITDTGLYLPYLAVAALGAGAVRLSKGAP